MKGGIEMGKVALAVGTVYPVMNTTTGESNEFTLGNIGQYKGKFLLYGSSARHGITVHAGMREVRARPSCFVFMGDEKAADVTALVERLGGMPIALIIGGYVGIAGGRSSVSAPTGAPAYPVLNSGPLYGDPALERGYQQGHKSQADMMTKAARLVDVWEHWKVFRKLPAWCKTSKPDPSNGLYLTPVA